MILVLRCQEKRYVAKVAVEMDFYIWGFLNGFGEIICFLESDVDGEESSTKD